MAHGKVECFSFSFLIADFPFLMKKYKFYPVMAATVTAVSCNVYAGQRDTPLKNFRSP